MSIVPFHCGSDDLAPSHFLLDLQEAYQRKVVGLATDDPLHTSQSLSIRSLNFATALGSLSATLDPADYGQEDDYEGTDDGLAALQGFPLNEGGSSQDLRAEDECAIPEVPGGGDSDALAVQ
ncbi:hypothetical protein LXA43DRAFT_25086 [Ganoderma leucocontextum]|nr:hypothetical protein LXA43DRAFT_25086 [Ganoderma leucocontextum]